MSAQVDVGDKHDSMPNEAVTSAEDAASASALSPFGRAALHLSRCHQAYLDAAVAPYGIAGSHVPMLIYLAEGGEGHTQNDIAHAVRLDKGTISRRVAQLARLGLVTQTTSELDSRAHRVALTEKGHALVQPISDICRRWDEEVAGRIPDASRAQLLRELEALNSRAELLLTEVRAVS